MPQAFYPYHLGVFSAVLAILIVPIGLSGALLPLLFHHLRNEIGDLGQMAGSLYSWNTVGSLLGAMLGGYVLLFWVDLPRRVCDRARRRSRSARASSPCAWRGPRGFRPA